MSESDLKHEEGEAMTETNRIGSRCWYKPADITQDGWKAGFLRAWSTDYELHPESPATAFPVAVIEDDKTGACSSVYVNRVCFAETRPGE